MRGGNSMKSSSKVIIAGILIFALYGIFSNSKNSSDDLYTAPSTNQEMQFDYTVPSNPVPNDSGSNPVIIPDSYSDYTVSEPVPEWCGICNGLGSCNICDGIGTYSNYGQSIPCTACGGTGNCWKCGGSGYK